MKKLILFYVPLLLLLPLLIYLAQLWHLAIIEDDAKMEKMMEFRRQVYENNGKRMLQMRMELDEIKHEKMMKELKERYAKEIEEHESK